MSDLKREERWAEAEFANGGRDAADRKARERQADVERVAEQLLGTIEYVLVPVWDKNMYGVAYKSGEGSEPRTIDAHRAFELAESFVSLRDRRRQDVQLRGWGASHATSDRGYSDVSGRLGRRQMELLLDLEASGASLWWHPDDTYVWHDGDINGKLVPEERIVSLRERDLIEFDGVEIQLTRSGLMWVAQYWRNQATQLADRWNP